MAGQVNLKFTFVIELHALLVENESIPPFMAWTVRDSLDEAAQRSLAGIDRGTVKEVIEILENRTLGEVRQARDEDPPSVGFSLVSAIWWLLHRKVILPEDYDD